MGKQKKKTNTISSQKVQHPPLVARLFLGGFRGYVLELTILRTTSGRSGETFHLNPQLIPPQGSDARRKGENLKPKPKSPKRKNNHVTIPLATKLNPTAQHQKHKQNVHSKSQHKEQYPTKQKKQPTNPTQPNQTKPNQPTQTKRPNPTKPNQTTRLNQTNQPNQTNQAKTTKPNPLVPSPLLCFSMQLTSPSMARSYRPPATPPGHRLRIAGLRMLFCEESPRGRKTYCVYIIICICTVPKRPLGEAKHCIFSLTQLH